MEGEFGGISTAGSRYCSVAVKHYLNHCQYLIYFILKLGWSSHIIETSYVNVLSSKLVPGTRCLTSCLLLSRVLVWNKWTCLHAAATTDALHTGPVTEINFFDCVVYYLTLNGHSNA